MSGNTPEGTVSPRAATVVSKPGLIFFVARWLHSSSALALMADSHANLSLNPTTGDVAASLAIAPGVSQTMYIRESYQANSIEYPITLTGAAVATSNSSPSFTVHPTISPTSGSAGSTTFTASNGTIINGTFTSRRWLLNSVPVGTGSTIIPNTGGVLALEVTATGSYGTTVSTSNVALIAGVGVITLANLSLSASGIAENAAAGTVVGGILNTSGGSTLSLTDTAGSRFALSGTNIVAGATATDFEANTTHNITIRETLAGAANTPRDTVIPITVTNVNEQANLSALTLSSTSFVTGTATSGAINGATVGSAINASGLPSGLTINGAARTWAWSGTGSAATTSIVLTETLADSANSPRTSNISVTISVPSAPVLTSPADAANGQAGATISVSTNTGNGTLYWFISTSATPPSAANLKAGTGAAVAGNQAVSATGTQSAAPSGLTPSTAYYTYFLHRSAASVDSAVSAADGFTTSAAVTPAITKAAIEGTSQDVGNSYPLGYAALTAGLTYTNYAVGGSTTAGIKTRIATNIVGNNFDAYICSTGAANDLTTFSTIADAKAAYLDLFTTAKAALVGGKMIVVRGVEKTDEAANNRAGHNARANLINTWLRSLVGGGVVDAYIPVEDPRYDYTGAANITGGTGDYSDGLHCNPASVSNAAHGATALAVISAIVAQAGVVPIVNPNSFTIPDLTNQDLNTAVTSLFMVQGLGMGAAATLSRTSGPATFKRGLGTDYTAATTFPVMTGDIVSANATTSASNSTAITDTVVAIGNKTDTWSVTTKANDGVIANDTFNRANGAPASTPTGNKTWYGSGQIDTNKLVLGQAGYGYSAIDPGSQKLRITWTGLELPIASDWQPNLMFGGHKTGNGGNIADFDNHYYFNIRTGQFRMGYQGGDYGVGTFTGVGDGTYTVVAEVDPVADSIVLKINGTTVMTHGYFIASGGNWVGLWDSFQSSAIKLDEFKVEVLP